MIKKITLISLVALVLACSSKDKTDDLPSFVSQFSQHEIEKNYGKDAINNLRKKTPLDDKTCKSLFENTALISKNGNFYQGASIKVIPLTFLKKNDKYLVSLLKDVEINGSKIQEIFICLLNEKATEILDLKYLGSNAEIAECRFKIDFRIEGSKLMANDISTCYTFDEKTDDEYNLEQKINRQIKILTDKLDVKIDTAKRKIR